MRLLPTLRAIAAPLLTYALPPRCPGCGCIVEDDHRFCLDCWAQLEFLGDPCCACCGLPFELPEEEGALCVPCMEQRPFYDSARAALAYGDQARAIAMRLKYGRRPGMARLMAQLMVRRLTAQVKGNPQWLLVPVPLHRWRQWSRGFNQAALIADHLGKLAELEVCKDVLLRSRATRPLREMSRTMRRKAMRGAFRIDPRHADRLQGRNILLIDDIHTSGATSEACAKALRQGGARSVHLLTWARVLGQRSPEMGETRD